jgi:nitrile hydratase subunit alpha
MTPFGRPRDGRGLCRPAPTPVIDGSWSGAEDELTSKRRAVEQGQKTSYRQGTRRMSDHDHDSRGSELSEMNLRVRALETILTEKGYVDPAALDAIVDTYENRIGPRNGTKVVARAWNDVAFKQALLEDATKAVNAFGGAGRIGDHLVAVENTPKLHNMVVCTLCSCYPIDLLGTPPVWYKSAPYRSRAVKDPRGVLADFGVILPPETEIRVWDSTAETRFLVLPMRPAGTDRWDEERLAALVTRDSMIGVGLPKGPGDPAP